jgi:hypothetical protein
MEAHMLRAKYLVTVVIVSALTAVLPATAGKSPSVNVTTIVHDFTAGSVAQQLLMTSDDYNGTGQATYSSALNPSVNSVITCCGGTMWRLLLGQQSVRTLWITPDIPVGSQPPGPASGYYWKDVEVYSVCYDQNNNAVALANIVTSSGNCSLGVDFYSAGIKYKLVMSPALPAPGPVTGLATVTCNALSSGECVNWTIVPNMTAANATVADLYQYGHGLAFIGQYQNTYRVDVTNP